MNILILNWKDLKHPQVGGAEIIVYELAKRLVSRGHKVTWFCRSFKYCKPFEVIEGISIVRQGNLITTYFLAPLYYWGLKTKPDIVIDMSNTIYWQSPLWAWKSKTLAYLNQLAKDVFFYEFPRGISRFGMIVERLQYIPYLFSKFVCYANSTKKDLMLMGIQANNISIFSLGIDHDRYKPGIKSRQPLFICVNRLVKMKRTDLVIHAMSKIVKKYPKSQLIIVGYGYDRKKLEMLRDSLDLQNNVYFADENILFFSKNVNDRKITLMQQAWALVFPSVKEGWGMTVTECGACGTPAIVSNVTGLCDSVIDNKTGLIMSDNPSPTEIACTMEKIIINKNLRINLSKNAIQNSKNYNWSNSCQEFEKIISNTINQH